MLYVFYHNLQKLPVGTHTGYLTWIYYNLPTSFGFYVYDSSVTDMP